MPHMTLRGPAAEGDFGDELRFDPDAFAAALFGRKLPERRRVAPQRLKPFPHVARGLHRVAGAGAASVFQLTVFIVTEHERADRTLDVRGILVAKHDEFLV